MIIQQNMPISSATCDVCKKDFLHKFEGWSLYFHEDVMLEYMLDAEWHIEGNKCYCPSCHKIDDYDNVIIKNIDNIQS